MTVGAAVARIDPDPHAPADASGDAVRTCGARFEHATSLVAVAPAVRQDGRMPAKPDAGEQQHKRDEDGSQAPASALPT